MPLLNAVTSAAGRLGLQQGTVFLLLVHVYNASQGNEIVFSG